MKKKIKINVWELPNKNHLEIQKKNRVLIHQPKKGKGSYRRKGKYDENYEK